MFRQLREDLKAGRLTTGELGDLSIEDSTGSWTTGWLLEYRHGGRKARPSHAGLRATILPDPPLVHLRQAAMSFFDTRRARVRPQFAPLYPEITPDVWLSARYVTRLVRQRGPREQCKQGCARGRVLCEIHFEFRGGRLGHQYLTGEWLPRVPSVLLGVAEPANSVPDQMP